MIEVETEDAEIDQVQGLDQTAEEAIEDVVIQETEEGPDLIQEMPEEREATVRTAREELMVVTERE